MHQGMGTTSSQLPGAFYISQFSDIGKRQTQKDGKTLPLLASLRTCTQPKSLWDYLYGPDNLTMGSPQGHLLQDTLQKGSHRPRGKGKPNQKVGTDVGE